MSDKQSNEGPGNQSGGIVGLSGKVVKRKLNVHTRNTKFQAIAEVEKGTESKAAIANKFEVPSNTLSTWLKNAEKIKESYEQYTIGPQRKKCAQSPTKTQKMLPYSGSKQYEIETCQCLALALLQAKAEEFASQLSETMFNWLARPI